MDSEYMLMNAIEAAILHHANTNSDWWHFNRQRLCTSPEGALRYFAIQACTAASASNLEVIGPMLCDVDLLQSSLSFELGTLIQAAFIHLDAATQDAVQAAILGIYQESSTDINNLAWRQKQQAQLLLPIPCHLRSATSQEVIDSAEHAVGPRVREPQIYSRSGVVSSPFSFEVFLRSSNATTLKLLDHYDGYLRNSFSDSLEGGEQEVGNELREAASRDPCRFISLLLQSWSHIPHKFRDDLMDGIATYLAVRHGNLQPNGNWENVKEADSVALAQDMLSVLEKYPEHWHHNRAAAKALESCAHVVSDTQTAERLIVLSMAFLSMDESDPVSGDSVRLLTIGINMAKGKAVDGLMVLAINFLESSTPLPETLTPVLQGFADDANPAVRAVMLRHLPYLQSLAPELGWQLFDIAMGQAKTAPGLWAMAEPCLYHAYHQNIETVRPWLTQLATTGSGKDLETWGRIAALAALSGKLDFGELLDGLRTMDSTDAWRGAASVWSHPENHQRHTTQCSGGLEAGMTVDAQHAVVVARQFRNLLRDTTPLITLPLPSLQMCFDLLALETEPGRRDTYGFDGWLNATSQTAPTEALAAAEIYVDFVRRTKPYLYDHESNLTQLLTHLFAYAEEMEESDSGEMIQRVVKLQDALLALGVNGMDEWLKAAERQ